MWCRLGNVVLLTLLNGISGYGHMPQCRLTNVDDVTLDHAILRANCTIGKTVFSGTACKLDSNDVRKCFLGAMGGSGPAISLSSQRFLFPKMMRKPTDEAVVDNILTHGMRPMLDYLESIAPDSGYFVGGALSIADISVVTCFLQAQYGDFAVDAAKYPKLARYLAAAFNNPIVTARMTKERAALAS